MLEDKNLQDMMSSIRVADLTWTELCSLYKCEIDDDDFYIKISFHMLMEKPSFLSLFFDFDEKRQRALLFSCRFFIRRDYQDFIYDLIACKRVRGVVLAEAIWFFLYQKNPAILGFVLLFLRVDQCPVVVRALIDYWVEMCVDVSLRKDLLGHMLVSEDVYVLESCLDFFRCHADADDLIKIIRINIDDDIIRDLKKDVVAEIVLRLKNNTTILF